MKNVASVIGVVMLAGCAFDSSESIGRSSDAVAVTPATCTVSGAGTLASPPPASFSGSATVIGGGGGSGTWTHTVLAGTRRVCIPADCPGNGRRVGHDRHRGVGHDIGRGRGHCEHSAPRCHDEPIYAELVGVVDDGTCAINGTARGTLTGSGTWNGAPVTFELNVNDTFFGDEYELTVSDSSGVVYYVNDTVATGDISVTGS